MSQTNEEKFYSFFKEKGLSDNAIYAMMGNVQQESGFYSSNVNNSSGAFGLFQWLGTRKQNLSAYAKEQGTAMSDFDTQLNFAWDELQGSENKTLQYLQSNSDKPVSELTVGFEKLFERSGGSAVSNRVEYAEQFASGDFTTSQSERREDFEEISSGVSGLVGNLVKGISIVLVIILGIVFLVLCVKDSVNLDAFTNPVKAVQKVMKKGGKSE